MINCAFGLSRLPPILANDTASVLVLLKRGTHLINIPASNLQDSSLAFVAVFCFFSSYVPFEHKAFGQQLSTAQIMAFLSSDWSSSTVFLFFIFFLLAPFLSSPAIHLHSFPFLCLQATVLSMLSVSLLLNTQSPASSQSPTRRFIPSARRNCWRSSTRVTTPPSSSGTRPSTRCRRTTSLSSRRSYPPTTCVWDVSAEVRGSRNGHQKWK